MKLEKNKENPFKRVGQDYRGKQRGVGFCSFLVRCLDSATVFFFFMNQNDCLSLKSPFLFLPFCYESVSRFRHLLHCQMEMSVLL